MARRKMASDELLIERHMGWVDPAYTFEGAFGFAPMAWQLPYLRETRNAVVLKGRQVGASTAAASICIRLIRKYPNYLAAIVSPSLNQSTEVKLRAKQGLERLGEELVLDSQSTLGLDNGSRIISLPGSAKSVRGWSANILVIDEAAFLDPDTFLAVQATVAATRGRVIVQSTPAAPFGHFYDLYTSRSPLWVPYHVSSEEAANVSQDWLASEKARLTDEEYGQEYRGEFSAPGLGLVDPHRLTELTGAPLIEPAEQREPTVWDRMRDSRP